MTKTPTQHPFQSQLQWATHREQQQVATELLTQTAQCPFSELQRFFAQGLVVAVSSNLDLIQVATAMAMDDQVAVTGWQQAGYCGVLKDQEAARWIEQDTQLWTLVIKPWIVVQEISP